MHDTLARHLALHKVYFDSLARHLRRLWQRDLLAEEENTIASFTLCASFMRLEAMERGLALASSADVAKDDFRHMSEQVGQHTADVIAELQRRAGPVAVLQVPADSFPNLLAWEEALLMQLRSRSSLMDMLRQRAAAIPPIKFGRKDDA